MVCFFLSRGLHLGIKDTAAEQVGSTSGDGVAEGTWGGGCRR